MRVAVALALAVLSILGCSRSEGKATFVNRVWKVSQSPTVERGQLYVFLSEGTLVIASEHGTPAFGKWRSDGDALTMVEEGIANPVEILGLSEKEFRIRINGRGEPVEMTLVPAQESPAR